MLVSRVRRDDALRPLLAGARPDAVMLGEPGSAELPDQVVAYLREVLSAHTNGPVAGGVCPVRGVPRCRDFADAYDRLATAGRLMAEPANWDQETPRRLR